MSQLEAELHRVSVIVNEREPKPEPFLSLVLQMVSSSFWRSSSSPIYPVLKGGKADIEPHCSLQLRERRLKQGEA